MARGVTQEQVNAAIDTLVAAGERPTIERVRAALGTGSPNTVTRMLDIWWAALGKRLAAQQQKVAMANAPAEVSALASQLWEQALRAARAEVREVPRAAVVAAFRVTRRARRAAARVRMEERVARVERELATEADRRRGSCP